MSQEKVNLTQAEFKGKVLQSLEDIKENINEIKDNLNTKVSTIDFDREVASLKNKSEQNYQSIQTLTKKVNDYASLKEQHEKLRDNLIQETKDRRVAEIRMIKIVFASLVAGSFIWVKESREIIIEFITTVLF